MIRVKLCTCGNQKVPGFSVCQKCINKKRREKYASSEEVRKRSRQRGNLRHTSGAARRVYAYHRFKAYAILGGPKCKRCGFADPRALQIDHINDKGNLNRKLGLDFYREVIRENGVGFQILCANCNWIKRAEYAGFSLSDYPTQCPPKPKRGRYSIVNPEDTYAHFYTDRSLKVVAKELGVSAQTLSIWWSVKFGRESYLKRGVAIQAKAASKTCKNRKGRKFKKRCTRVV